MNKKYKLTKETKDHFGTNLYRIEALKDFGGVSKGDKGGWIEKESNLSVYGNAWVSGDANVYGDAKVYGSAWVSGDAKVYGSAKVSGDAKVYGQLKLKAGFFFGVRWSSDTEIKEVKIEDGNYLVYKGNAEFDDEDDDVEISVEGKTVKISRKSAKALGLTS